MFKWIIKRKTIRYTRADKKLILGKAIKTGYDGGDTDAEQLGQNFHAQDDDAYSYVYLSELSTKAGKDILAQKGTIERLPRDFNINEIKLKFKWNCEWEDWSDIYYKDEKIWEFCHELPFKWISPRYTDVYLYI